MWNLDEFSVAKTGPLLLVSLTASDPPAAQPPSFANLNPFQRKNTSEAAIR